LGTFLGRLSDTRAADKLPTHLGVTGEQGLGRYDHIGLVRFQRGALRGVRIAGVLDDVVQGTPSRGVLCGKC
jgi:hypothetical protein